MSLQLFYKKINCLYLQYVLRVQFEELFFYCKLCDQKYEKSWDKHEGSQSHRNALNCIANEFIDKVFSPGIVFKAKVGSCIFCKIELKNFFFDLTNHLNESHHQEQVKAYKECKFSAKFKTCRFSVNVLENDIFKKVIGGGLKVAGDKKFECAHCNYSTTNRKKFLAYITNPHHLEWAVNQLCDAADMIHFRRGSANEKNGFFCLICKKVIGDELSGVDLSTHISDCENFSIEDNVDPKPGKSSSSSNKGGSSSADENFSSDNSSRGTEESSPSREEEYINQSDKSSTSDKHSSSSNKGGSSSADKSFLSENEGSSSGKEDPLPSGEEEYINPSDKSSSSSSGNYDYNSMEVSDRGSLSSGRSSPSDKGHSSRAEDNAMVVILWQAPIVFIIIVCVAIAFLMNLI